MFICTALRSCCVNLNSCSGNVNGTTYTPVHVRVVFGAHFDAHFFLALVHLLVDQKHETAVQKKRGMLLRVALKMTDFADEFLAPGQPQIPDSVDRMLPKGLSLLKVTSN